MATLTCSSSMVVALAAAASLVSVSRAATATWDGSASSSWNAVDNWDTAALPVDVAAFTNTGLSASEVITLDAAQAINSLSLDTTTTFSIGNAAGNTAGHTLTLGGITRSAASSGTHTVVADIVLAGDSVWDINGSGYLGVSKVGGSGSITKNGTGELRFVAAQTAAQRSGATTINSGALSITGAFQLGSGALTVGDGTNSATFYLRWGNNWNFDAIGNSAAVTVRNNAVLDLETYYTAAGTRAESVGSLTIDAGGLVKLGKFGLAAGAATSTSVLMKGGTITGTAGNIAPSSGYVTVDAAATEMAVIASNVAIRQQYSGGTLYTRFNTNDTADVPVDMKVTGTILNGWDNRDGLDKIGAGVLRFTGSNTYGGRSTSEGATRVQAGTLLVDNTTGSGTGSSYVTVSGGATLGGSGTIGGLSGATNANVNLAGSGSSALATLAPGSIDETSGDHVIGVLTVGSATQNNGVTFGNYSRLLAQLGNAGDGDLLAVVGNLSLASAGNSDALVLQTVSGATLSGLYTLATFSGTLTGRFDSVSLDGGTLGSYQLQYRDASDQVIAGGDPITGGGSIVLVIPEPSAVVMTLAAGVASLCMRRGRRA